MQQIGLLRSTLGLPRQAEGDEDENLHRLDEEDEDLHHLDEEDEDLHRLDEDGVDRFPRQLPCPASLAVLMAYALRGTL